MINFLYDITRPPFKNWGTHVSYAQQICGFFEWQIQKISNNPLKLIKTNLETLNGFDRKRFYSLMNISFDEKNWVKIYDTTPTKEAAEYLSNFIDNTKLILSYESSPTILKIFDILKISYIDIRFCPIKYLDDLALGFKTNNKEIFSKILKYKVSEDQFKLEASLLKSRIRLVNQDIHSKIQKNSAIFIGQTFDDASLIKNNKFLTPLDFKKQFIEKTYKYDCIYYKKHPFDKNKLTNSFIADLPNTKEINTNIYHLMCSDNIKEFFSISSGSIQEAEYFTKNTSYFFQPIYNFITDKEVNFCNKKYISVYKGFFEPNFWANILGPVINTKKCNNVELPFMQNKLRYLHNIYWGYDSLIKDYNPFFKENANNSIKKLEKKIDKLSNKRITKKIINSIKNLKIFKHIRLKK